MSQARSTYRMEVHVARMVVVMVLAFLLTWLPYAAVALSVVVDSSLRIHPIVATVPVVLAKSSAVYNPIIYIFMNRQVSVDSLVYMFTRDAPTPARLSPRLLPVKCAPSPPHQHQLYMCVHDNPVECVGTAVELAKHAAQCCSNSTTSVEITVRSSPMCLWLRR